LPPTWTKDDRRRSGRHRPKSRIEFLPDQPDRFTLVFALTVPGLEGLRVVVVDDEDDTRVLMRALLERCGAAVTAVGSAREALAVLEVVQPDVLVSDIAMPGDDGYTLIRRLRSRPRDRGGEVPAIALTAYARREDEMRAVEAGYQMHVVKPVDPGALAHAIARLARRGDAQSPP